MGFARECFEVFVIIERNVELEGLQRYSPIHCAAVEIKITEQRCNSPSCRTLSRACWAIDGNREFGRHGRPSVTSSLVGKRDSQRTVSRPPRLAPRRTP